MTHQFKPLQRAIDMKRFCKCKCTLIRYSVVNLLIVTSFHVSMWKNWVANKLPDLAAAGRNLLLVLLLKLELPYRWSHFRPVQQLFEAKSDFGILSNCEKHSPGSASSTDETSQHAIPLRALSNRPQWGLLQSILNQFLGNRTWKTDPRWSPPTLVQAYFKRGFWFLSNNVLSFALQRIADEWFLSPMQRARAFL